MKHARNTADPSFAITTGIPRPSNYYFALESLVRPFSVWFTRLKATAKRDRRWLLKNFRIIYLQRLLPSLTAIISALYKIRSTFNHYSILFRRERIIWIRNKWSRARLPSGLFGALRGAKGVMKDFRVDGKILGESLGLFFWVKLSWWKLKGFVTRNTFKKERSINKKIQKS